MCKDLKVLYYTSAPYAKPKPPEHPPPSRPKKPPFHPSPPHRARELQLNDQFWSTSQPKPNSSKCKKHNFQSLTPPSSSSSDSSSFSPFPAGRLFRVPLKMMISEVGEAHSFDLLPALAAPRPSARALVGVSIPPRVISPLVVFASLGSISRNNHEKESARGRAAGAGSRSTGGVRGRSW